MSSADDGQDEEKIQLHDYKDETNIRINKQAKKLKKLKILIG